MGQSPSPSTSWAWAQTWLYAACLRSVRRPTPLLLCSLPWRHVPQSVGGTPVARPRSSTVDMFRMSEIREWWEVHSNRKVTGHWIAKRGIAKNGRGIR